MAKRSPGPSDAGHGEAEGIRRRDVLKKGAQIGLATSLLAMPAISTAQASRPNVLWISIDDLNDWVAPLAGYPVVRTPNMTRLARLGRVYTNAQANVPVCSGSRTATLFGLQPYRNGVYTNEEVWQRNAYLANRMSLPRYLRSQGYLTYGTGKVFHSYLHRDIVGTDPAAWDVYEFCGAADTCHIEVVGDIASPRNGRQVVEISRAAQLTPMVGATLDFGPYYQTSEVPDTVRARWMADSVLKVRHRRPFFAACGIIKPHLPAIVPQRFFDLYPDEAALVYPPGVLDRTHSTQATNADVVDLGATGKRINTTLRDHELLLQTGEWKAIIRAYLASISFADYCVGLLLDGLQAGPNNANTIVVLWSDHGWQLGEKLAWRKFTLWERALRVPLIISGPGIRPATSGMPVSLIDLYPTVTDLALGRVPAGLDGRSLKRNLQSGTTTHDHSVSTWREVAGLPNGGPHFSIRTATHRYIRYQSGEKGALRPPDRSLRVQQPAVRGRHGGGPAARRFAGRAGSVAALCAAARGWRAVGRRRGGADGRPRRLEREGVRTAGGSGARRGCRTV